MPISRSQKYAPRKLLILNEKLELKLSLEHKLADLAQKRAEVGRINNKKGLRNAQAQSHRNLKVASSLFRLAPKLDHLLSEKELFVVVY